MQKVLAIVGPTAIGKTSLAIEVAQKFNAEIISGDSMQVYREVAIGTAKATSRERQAVKHYLVDTQSVFKPYSVKNFVEEAESAIAEVAKRNKLPLLVGGTGFYVNALLNKMQLGEKEDHKDAINKRWQDFLNQNGQQKLWEKLNQLDQEAATKIPVNNTRRILRALTVIDRTGKKFSEQQTQINQRYDYLIFGLNSDRQEIYRRIDRRVDQMMQDGLLNEAEFIYQNRECVHQIIQAIAYKEFFPYFNNEKSLKVCVENLKISSHHYAKRQLTYFRHQLPIIWVDPLKDLKCLEKIEQKAEEWLNE